jgi:hypothetical protein
MFNNKVFAKRNLLVLGMDAVIDLYFHPLDPATPLLLPSHPTVTGGNVVIVGIVVVRVVLSIYVSGSTDPKSAARRRCVSCRTCVARGRAGRWMGASSLNGVGGF